MPTHYSQLPEGRITFEAFWAGLDHLTVEELQILKQELDRRWSPADDWLNTEYVAYAQNHGDPSIRLGCVRETLAKIEVSMSDEITGAREDRF